jgi:hypothetical protein
MNKYDETAAAKIAVNRINHRTGALMVGIGICTARGCKW